MPRLSRENAAQANPFAAFVPSGLSFLYIAGAALSQKVSPHDSFTPCTSSGITETRTRPCRSGWAVYAAPTSHFRR